MQHIDLFGNELKVGDYVLYCEAGRGSSSSLQNGTITRMTPKTVFVQDSKYEWRRRQSSYPQNDLCKITKEQFDLLGKR